MIKQEESYNASSSSGFREVQYAASKEVPDDGSTTVVVKGLPHDMLDAQLEQRLRELIPKGIIILSIDIRSTKRLRAATAFIRLSESRFVDEVIRLLDKTHIRDRMLFVNRDDNRRFTTLQQRVNVETHVPYQGYPTGPTVPLQSESSFRSSLSNPSNQSQSLIAASETPILAQLYISSLPYSMTESNLREILYEHFQNNGHIILRNNSESVAAFVNIYNYSKVPIPIIMERMSGIMLGDRTMNVSYQKNPRPITSTEELDGRAGLERMKLGDFGSPRMTQDLEETLCLHLVPFASSMSAKQIHTKLKEVFLVHFNSPVVRFNCVESKKHLMAFVEIINKSAASDETLMLELGRIVFISREGTYKLGVSLQKGTAKPKNIVEELPAHQRHWRPDNRSLSPNRNYSERSRSRSRFRSISPPPRRRRQRSRSRTRSRSRSRSRNRSRSRSPIRNYSKSSRRDSDSHNRFPSLPLKIRDQSPSHSTRSTKQVTPRSNQRIELSPDPFDTVTPSIDSSTSIDYSSIILSLDDPSSLEQATKPINTPLHPSSNPITFIRDLKTQITLGYLSSKEVESIHSINSNMNVVAPFEDETLQLKYEDFLLAQQGGRKYYLDLLEKAGEFSERSKRFSEIAKVVVDSVKK